MLILLFHCKEIGTVAAACVFTAVVAATDSTSAKTISDTANVAAFAIFDVSAAISVVTALSPLRNR